MKDRRFFLVLILLVLTGLMSYASAEETLIENEKARVVLKSFEQKNDTVEMKLFLENKTDKNVMFSIEDAVLNGWETNPFWAVTVSGGKKANETEKKLKNKYGYGHCKKTTNDRDRMSSVFRPESVFGSLR